MIVDAAQHIPRDKPVSHVDARILHCADRLGTVLGESEPTPPTPFDRRIEEALAAEAEKREEWEAADEERIERARDVDSLTGAGLVTLKGGQGPVTIWTGHGVRARPVPKRRHADRALVAAQASQEAFERVSRPGARELFRSEYRALPCHPTRASTAPS